LIEEFGVSIIHVHGKESAMMQFPCTNNSLQELQLEEEMAVNLTAKFFGVHICEGLV